MPEKSGISQLEIAFEFNGAPRVINPTLIWDEENVVLVDAGFPRQLPLFRDAIQRLGVPFHRVNRIIITHQDRDHIGGLAEIVDASVTKVEVAAHELEKPYIQGDQVFVKKPAGLPSGVTAPPAMPAFARVKLSRVLADGDELPFGGGVTVIHTPGHTPGHICLYHAGTRTLVTGDALNLVDGALTGPNPQFTYDLFTARNSLKKLARFDIETVICYHGGVYRGDANRRIAELANQ